MPTGYRKLTTKTVYVKTSTATKRRRTTKRKRKSRRSGSIAGRIGSSFY